MDIQNAHELTEARKRSDELITKFILDEPTRKLISEARAAGEPEWRIRSYINDMASLPKHMRNSEQMMLLKRKLGLRVIDPLPRCPAKSDKKAGKLAKEGYLSHAATGHACNICRCDSIAGLRTNHIGYGLCRYHEQSRRYKHRKELMAEKHRLALVAREPREMVTISDFEASVVKDADSSKSLLGSVRMIPAAEKVSRILHGFWNLLSEYEANDGYRKEAASKLVEIQSMLSAQQNLSKESLAEIEKAIKEIEFKMRVPITERGGKEMSGEVRIKLVSETLSRLVTAMKDLSEIMNARSIPAEQFRIWLAALHKNMSSEFGESSYIREDGEPARIMDGIAVSFVKTGDPSRAG